MPAHGGIVACIVASISTIHANALQSSSNRAARANHAVPLTAAEILKDNSMRAAFQQFRLFLEFQEHREQLAKCGCGSYKINDAALVTLGDENLRTSGLEQTKGPDEAKIAWIHKPFFEIENREVREDHTKPLDTQPVKKGHLTFNSSQTSQAMEQADSFHWKGASPQAMSAAMSHNHEALKSQNGHSHKELMLLNVDVTSLLWLLKLLQAFDFYDYFFWVPLLVISLVIFFNPRFVILGLWKVSKRCIVAVYNYLFEPDLHADDSEEGEAKVQKHGIAMPANILWKAAWDQLTEGQRGVFREIGIHDEHQWFIRSGLHQPSAQDQENQELKRSMRDWEDLRTRERKLLSKIGFSRESWHRMSDEMAIHEKTWIELSNYEKRAILKVDANLDAEKWNHRSADLFHTPWEKIPASQIDHLRKLGFSARAWRTYQDPKFKPAWSWVSMKAFLYEAAASPIAVITSLLTACAAVWTLFAMWRLQMLQYLVEEIGIYSLLFVLLLSCLVVAFKETIVLMHAFHNDVVTKVRRVHLYIANFWEKAQELPQDIAEITADITRIASHYKAGLGKCCHCGSSCFPKKR